MPGLAELCPGHKTLSFADSEESGGGGLVAKLCPTLATLWTVARQAPLSMGFSRQEHWSGLPFPSPGDLSDPGTEPAFPALAGGFFTAQAPGKPFPMNICCLF